MFVTLEVSKLSGWLNADAPCQESNGGHTVWGEVQSTGRGGRRRTTAVQAACKAGLDCRFGAGHGVERTLNMWFMSVTLEVSKLSGWLNADAACRESKGGHAVRSEVYQSAGGRQRTTAAQAACRRGSDCRFGAGHGEERTLNMPNMFVTLEVSKLSGWLNADTSCRESKGGHTVRQRGASREAGGRRATAVHSAFRGTGLDCAVWGQGTGRGARRTSCPFS